MCLGQYDFPCEITIKHAITNKTIHFRSDPNGPIVNANSKGDNAIIIAIKNFNFSWLIIIFHLFSILFPYLKKLFKYEYNLLPLFLALYPAI